MPGTGVGEAMTKYFVVTPPYEDYETGSCGSDVVEVEADTKREALVKGGGSVQPPPLAQWWQAAGYLSV